MPFVLDNSVVSAWVIGSQATAYSASIAERLQSDRAVAPLLLRLEYVNVLCTACRRQRMVVAQAQEALGLLARLPIDIDAEDRMRSRSWIWLCAMLFRAATRPISISHCVAACRLQRKTPNWRQPHGLRGLAW